MAMKFNNLSLACLVFIACATTVFCGGDHGGHKTIKIDVPFKVHTIHHYHEEKVPIIKKIEVPVIKEVKEPFKVYVPVKVPYPVVIKPHIVTVPVHHYPVHSTEHKHHETHDYGHGDEGGHSDGGHDEGYSHSEGW